MTDIAHENWDAEYRRTVEPKAEPEATCPALENARLKARIAELQGALRPLKRDAAPFAGRYEITWGRILRDRRPRNPSRYAQSHSAAF